MTTPVLLVRHADAGDRSKWTSDQDLRPLTDRGRLQADGIVTMLREFAPERILSSRALRCVQTVEPLAAALGLEIEIVDELHEGRTTEALRLFDGTPLALSSHGDVLPELLDAVAGHLDVFGDNEWFEKGAACVLDLDAAGKVVSARYFPPAT